MQMPSVGLNAVVGRPFEEYGMEPTSLEQLREGATTSHARIDDMNVNGIAASLNFGSCVGFDGGRFHKAPDKAKSLIHLRAYNDWHIDEWCGAYPGRFIPCAHPADLGHGRHRRRDQAPREEGLHAPSRSTRTRPSRACPASTTNTGSRSARRSPTRHDDLPAHRRRQSGAACVDGDADRGVDHDHADVDRQSAPPTGCNWRRCSAIRT